MKLKELLGCVHENTICEVTYTRKNRPEIRETASAEDIKYRNQYIVDDIQLYGCILKIKVRERKKK